MATAKVRIFELAKELGISSKELIALFDRLGLEAKNQLSVVDDKIADLVRGVLLRKRDSAAKAPSVAAVASAPAAGSVATVEAPPAPPAAPAAAVPAPPVVPTVDVVRVESVAEVAAPPAPKAAPVAQPSRAVPPEEMPVNTLRPVTTPQRRPSAPRNGVAADGASVEAQASNGVLAESSPNGIAPVESVAASADVSPVAVNPTTHSVAPEVAETAGAAPAEASLENTAPTAPRPPARPVFDTQIPTLRPVPRGQNSIARPTGPPANAPKQTSGIPGRPGVVPPVGGRPLGSPAQPFTPRTGTPLSPPNMAAAGLAPAPRPGVPGAPAVPGAPGRPTRPTSNGPFRPLAPPGPRPFTPRPPGAGNAGGGPGGPSMPTSATGGAAPSSGSAGGRPGVRSRDRDSAAAKKDREKELLLEKERQRKKRGSLDAAPAIQPTVLENIEIPDVLTVQELATSMIIPAKDVIKELIKMGTMATINQNIPSDTAIAVAKKFGFNAIVKEAGDEVVVEQEEDRPEMLTTRPPVVTVLGHVDHGKTSLLDRIRSANVASGEAGGITQRIGAYTIEKNDRKITFIDTPGHEAFTAMRARGAKVTDVAILVVAADDGVMPQTLEAISHIRAAGVPIVVAVNKIDKDNAQPDRVKTQLSEQGLQPIDWGGTTEMVMVSAKKGIGIDELLETVLLEADVRELKANKNRRASGVVIESALDRGRGAVATVLIQNGTLRVGDIVVVGGAYGKIRALIDDKGKQVKKAGPSIPVEIMGLSDVPSAGDTLMVVSDERIAREAALKRSTRRRDTYIAASGGTRVSLESFMAMPAESGLKTLNLILKADGQGSVEALRSRVSGLTNSEVEIRVIHAGVGAITPNDVNLASASNAVLIGFNIRPDETVKRLAENERVDLRFYQVIYDVENDLRRAMVGLLAPKYREIILGRGEVRELFKVSKIGTIAGCYIQNGKLTRNAKVRVLRDSAVVFDGVLDSIRRFKDDVKEVSEGYECGVQIAKFADLKPQDVIEAYASELVAPELAAI